MHSFMKNTQNSEVSRYTHCAQIDKAHIWHPFTPWEVWRCADPLIIESGQGVELIDIDGLRYLDGVSSLWCNVHGHSHPSLLETISGQAQKLCHSTMLGLSHLPVIELTEQLIRIVPDNLSRVFYADSGTTAVEAALRMSLEWWQKQGGSGQHKTKLLSLVGAYHGDSLGAVGVGFLESFHKSLTHAVIPALRVKPPHIYRFFEGESPEIALEKSLADLSATLVDQADTLAAMIVEPLVQGAAGIWVHPDEYLREAARLCKLHNVLFIADEVATGFGKTGSMFSVEKAGVKPDILVLGKGLSAGYLPISAAVTTEEIFLAFGGDPQERKTFYYGQTFCGNPLAAAVATENLKIFARDHVLDLLPGRIEHFAKELEKQISGLAHVDEVRRLGLMTGIDFTQTPGKRDPHDTSDGIGMRITMEARKRGAIIRPLGDTMVLMPALAMKEDDLTKLVEITAQAIEAVLGN